jgi:membrane protein implicated in regulation of membrane protease activity
MGIIDPALYWLIIGVMLFFLEMAVPGFILFFFGLGAFVTALVAWLAPMSIAWQLALFIVTSLSALWSLRDIIQKKFLAPKGEDEEGEGGDEDVTVPIAGEKGVVSMTIAPPAEGQVKYSGTFWRATADEEIEEGEIIAVVRRKGIVIHVEKV